MTNDSWILDLLSSEKMQAVMDEATRYRLGEPLGVAHHAEIADEDFRFAACALDLCVFTLLETDDLEALREAADKAFLVVRTLPINPDTMDGMAELVRVACFGVLGGRGADVRRLLETAPLQDSGAKQARTWGERVSRTVFEVWLRLFRKQGCEDLDGVQAAVAALRADQREGEAMFLSEAKRNRDVRPAWELISQYHLVRAAEILGAYLVHGAVDGHCDVREQLEAQFDRAISAAAKGGLMEREVLGRLLARTASILVDNSI